MHDFKRLHKSNWPEPERKDSILEYIGGGFLITATIIGLMILAIYKETGGI